jgi:hypothetical protein
MGTGSAMSPTTDEFDEGLRTLGLGSRYREGSPGAFRSLYATVELAARQMRDQLVSEVGASKRVPEILAGVNDSSAFNAFAAPLSGRRYIIAVNYGTLILIHDLVHRLFCLPEFFPWVGDPSKEDRTRQFHPTCDDAMSYMRTFITEPRLVIPRDPLRKQAAAFLIPLAVYFLVAHEFRHIVGGHLGWLNSHSGQMTISEVLGLERDPGSDLLLQALEMDADQFAMYYTLMRALAIAKSPEETLPASLRGIISTPLQSLDAALACALLMIGTFFPPPGPPEEWRFYSHPPAGVRHVMNMWGADRALRQLGQEELSAATLGNQQSVRRYASFTFSHLAQRLGNADRKNELQLQFRPRGQEHFLEIVNAWGTVQDEVHTCAL